MTIKVSLPPFLSDKAEGHASIDIEAKSVTQALYVLGSRYPNLKDILWRTDMELNPYLVLFCNNQDIVDMGGLETPLRDGDELTIVTALEGGC